MSIQFQDKLVSYDTFLEDLATRICSKLQQAKTDPDVVSQRKAYTIFGRANVDRWRRQGRVTPCKRIGKVEYKMVELRACQQTKQDYLLR